MGLATSYSIIRNHGGLIDVRSVLGKGTVFSFYLPAAVTKQKVGPGPSAAVSEDRRAGRILVMDDEELIRSLLLEMLDTLGHHAELAVNGAEALAKYREAMSEGRPFDVVVLDLTVRGGMGGAETLRRLRELDPGVKAIMSSGYSNDNIASSYQDAGFKAFLKKPYRIDDLRNELNRLLSE